MCSIEDLERGAASGDHAPQFTLGLKREVEGWNDAARGLLGQAAAGGNIDALTALAINLLTCAPLSHYEGVRSIIEATNGGSGQAIAIAGAMSALGAGLPQDWAAALECLQRGAERGWTPAQEELRLLASHTSADLSWKALRDSVDLDDLLTPGQMRVHEQPRISVCEKFLTPQICDWLIAKGGPKVQRATIFDTASASRQVVETRSNSAAEFNIVETDIVLALIRARISALTGLPTLGMEHTQILHYTPGQQFAPHFDFLDPAVPAYAKDIARAGQRLATFLVYLNDDFDGAPTSFLKLDWRYRGAKGDAILFWNVDPSGVPDRSTLHAGLAPTRGEKWLLSQWIRHIPA
ncbi:MAG TPA: 2OG-Fe(II) oxygenase [Rhizomicrobium sp.]